MTLLLSEKGEVGEEIESDVEPVLGDEIERGMW